MIKETPLSVIFQCFFCKWIAMISKLIPATALLLTCSFFDCAYSAPTSQYEGVCKLSDIDKSSRKHKKHFPGLVNNPLITYPMRALMAPYIIPIDSPLKPILDSIFSVSRATQNRQTFAEAGFVILFSQESSYIVVAKHSELPDYIFKVYLDSELRIKKKRPGWFWLKSRCEGAKRAKRLITKGKIKHFVVPDKWIYPLPIEPISEGPSPQPIILIEPDMHLVKYTETVEAWKTVVTTDHLDELYYLLSNGAGSNFLPANIPYTKDGKFALIDTEYPKRKINLHKVTRHLSDEMQAYWEHLIKTNGKG